MSHRCKAHHLILALSLIGSLIAFSPVLTSPFRSDEWYIANFARHAPLAVETVVQTASWELFGDPRFQPFSHLLLFLVHKVLGNTFILFHLLSWTSHVVAALLIYAIVQELHGDKMTASLCSALFITGFSHFDAVSWTYHLYIIHQAICLLVGFWIVLRNPLQLRWWQTLTGGTLVGLASYFYEAALVIPVLILIMACRSHYALHRSGAKSKSHNVAVFVLSVTVFFGGFLGLYLSETGDQISGRVDAGVFATASINTLKGLWRQGVVGNLGFPPQYAVGDLLYLQGSKFGASPIVAVSFFIIAFAMGFRSQRPDVLRQLKGSWYLVVIFLGCAVSYYGVIAIGRFNLYVLTQSRYFYLPDIFLVLAFSWPMAVACAGERQTLDQRSNTGWRRIGTALLRPRSWVVSAVCMTAVLNGVHVFGMCREIAWIVSPVKTSIETVNRFSQTHNREKQLYVDFVPRNMDDRLFGGTHIALETCFGQRGVLTRHVGKASYVYEKTNGIVPKEVFGSYKADSGDFTLEFDYVMWGDLITVIDSRKNTFRIRRLPSAQNEHLLRLTHAGKEGPQEIYMTAKHPWRHVSHVVVQKQGANIYAIEGGRLIAVKPAGAGEVLWKDKALFLGSQVVFPPQYCYLENFFACVGKAKYDLQGKGVGDVISDSALRAPMPALNSDPRYWKSD